MHSKQQKDQKLLEALVAMANLQLADCCHTDSTLLTNMNNNARLMLNRHWNRGDLDRAHCKSLLILGINLHRMVRSQLSVLDCASIARVEQVATEAFSAVNESS